MSSPHSTMPVIRCRQVVPSTPSHQSSDPETVSCLTADCRRMRYLHRIAACVGVLLYHMIFLVFTNRAFASIPQDLYITSISTSQPPQHRRHLNVAVFSTLLKDIIAVSDVEFLNLTTSRSSRLRLPAVGRSTAEQLVGPAPQSHTLITLQRSPTMSCRELHASIIMVTAQLHIPIDGNSSSLPTHQSCVFSLVLSHANGRVH
jgi:hypothetical protein